MFLTRKEMQALLKAYREDFLPICITRGGDSHRCEMSPIKICVYYPMTDPCCDDCIFCHLPYERK